MRKWRVGFSIGVLLSAVAVVPAVAADMAMPKKAPVIAPAPVARWAGFYIGVHAGYGWGDPDAVVDPGSAPLPTGTITAFAPASSFTLSNRPKGWLGGLQLGYNWQFDRVVAGIEADASFAGLKDSASGDFINLYNRNGDATRTVGTAALETKVDALGTLRGRLGYALAPTLLPYATGGLAWGYVKNTVTVSGSHYDIGGGLPGTLIGSFSNSSTSSDWLLGYSVGGGFDWAIDPRWSLRAEYLYINLSGKTHTSVVPGIASTSTAIDMSIARVALNYKFAP